MFLLFASQVASCFQLAWFTVYLVKPEDVIQLLWFGKEVRIVCFGHLLRFGKEALSFHLFVLSVNRIGNALFVNHY